VSNRIFFNQLTWFVVLFLLLVVTAVAMLFTVPNGFFARSRGEFTENDGVKIFYSIEGEGEPVVLLHGFAVNGDLNWTLSKVRKQLAPHYRLIIPDLRGHGLSDKPHDPEKYGAEMAKDISALLKHLNVSNAVIAGYSLGGFVALKFASLYAEQTKKVLVMGAGWDRMGNESLAEKLKPAAIALRENKGVPPLATFLNPNKKPGLFHSLWVYALTKLFNDPLALAAMIEGSQGLTLTQEELAGIRPPVCVIVGDEDPFFASAKNIKTVRPASEIHILAGKNHMTAVTSEEFISVLTGCISY
jgi:pimeloyl-ACP methyl ester carboxylesterase